MVKVLLFIWKSTLVMGRWYSVSSYQGRPKAY